MNLGPATQIINQFSTIWFYLIGLNSSYSTSGLTLIHVLFSVVKIVRFIIELIIAYFFIKKSGDDYNQTTSYREQLNYFHVSKWFILQSLMYGVHGHEQERY